MHPVDFASAVPALVPLRLANNMRLFFETITGPRETRLLPRLPERGRVVEFSCPHYDLRVVTAYNEIPATRLAEAAAERRRTQIVVRMPPLPNAMPVVDIALMTAAEVLILPRRSLWMQQDLWWLVPQLQGVGTVAFIGIVGIGIETNPPWRNAQELKAGFFAAHRRFAAAMRGHAGEEPPGGGLEGRGRIA